MGWLSDIANNGINVSAAQNWINQQKEEAWAAEKEEERRKERVEAQESYSYNPPPEPAPVVNDKAKEAAKKIAETKPAIENNQQVGSKASDTAKAIADKTGTVQAPQTNAVSWIPSSSGSTDSTANAGSTSQPSPSIKEGLKLAPEPTPEPVYEPAPAPAPAAPAPEPTPEPAPEPKASTGETRAEGQAPQVYTPEEAAADAVSAALMRAERQTPAVTSYVEEETEKSNGSKGWIKGRTNGEPIVFTGGTSTVSQGLKSARSVAAQTKAEITGEDDDATILSKYWAMSPEEQAEQVSNPRVQAALRAQANQQAAGNRGNGYLPSNPLYSEGFSTRGDYDPRATQYTFNGQLREVGVENNRPYDRPLYPAAQNDQRAAEYLAAWQRRNADIQQQLAMQNYQYDPLQAAILRANAGLGGSGLETRGYDPGIRLAGDQQYLADNGFSWAGNPSLQSEDRGGTYVPPTAEGQEDYDTQVRILKDRGYSQEDAERMAAEEFGNYTYSGDQPSYVRRDVEKGTADPAVVRQGYYQEGYQLALSQNLSEVDAMRYAENYAIEKTNALQKAGQMTEAERARRNPNASYYYEPVAGTGAGTPARSGTQTPATTPRTSGSGTGNQTPRTETNTRRPGADAALNDTMKSNGYSWVPDSVRFAQERGTRTAQYLQSQAAVRNGQNTGNTGTTGTTGSSGSGNGSKAGSKTPGKAAEAAVPKGSKILKPTYGQQGDVVKAPYKAGGYTEDELRAMGNNAYGRKSGRNAYEGYYEWNGKYYPVDQIKANYYNANHHSYRGWEEPMREYYNTFGTFYGYRPDWKTAGGVNVWKQNRPATKKSYSYSGNRVSATPAQTPTPAPAEEIAPGNTTQRLRLSGYTGGSGGGYNYGRGYTANNGIYYNPNTSWSI